MTGTAAEILLQPFQLKGLTIRNRIMSTAHTSGAGEDGKPKERYQRYQEEKAIGGIGLTIIGGSTAVAPDSPGADMLHLESTDDSIIPWYQQLANRLHRHGTTVFAQVAHMGRRASYDTGHWLPPVAPSRVREPAHRAFPRELEMWDVPRLVGAFAAAARRVQEGGIDGVELSATHGHLLDQFWSPRVNTRTDAYGGSLPGRVRFSLEVLHAVREAVGDDFVVGLRMAGDELVEGGLSGDDCRRIAVMLADTGALDYLSVLGGQAENLPAHAAIFPGMEARPAPFLPLARRVRDDTGLPVFHAQRFADVGTAARAIAAGDVDMVGMTRAHLADPHLVRKLAAGEESTIRPCVGANYCIDRLYAGGQALCLHNPATGRELTMPHVIRRAERRRRVVVVGGGPAGLEAARVSAERGHFVVLFERDTQLGGLVRVAGGVGWRLPLRDIVTWLERRVRALGVEVRTDTPATADIICAIEPDLVVIATGGRPAIPALTGTDHVETAIDVLRTPQVPITGPVVVFDDNGAEPALTVAEVLARHAPRLMFVTPDPSPGILLERTTRPTFLRRLYRSDVEFVPDSRVTAVDVDGDALRVTVRNEYSGQTREVDAARVVVEHGTIPDDALYRALQPLSHNNGEVDLGAMAAGGAQPVAPDGAGFTLYRIGDAVASRNIHAALFDALRLCKDIT